MQAKQVGNKGLVTRYIECNKEGERDKGTQSQQNVGLPVNPHVHFLIPLQNMRSFGQRTGNKEVEGEEFRKHR